MPDFHLTDDPRISRETPPINTASYKCIRISSIDVMISSLCHKEIFCLTVEMSLSCEQIKPYQILSTSNTKQNKQN